MFSYVEIQVIYFDKDVSEGMCSTTLYQEGQVPTSATTSDDIHIEPLLEKALPTLPSLSVKERYFGSL